MSWPCASNSAQEKSRRSLMLTELAVLASVTPICSAMAMKRLLKISSSTGSARVGHRVAARGGGLRRAPGCRRSVNVARQPCSTTTVVLRSQITAGPSSASPGRRCSRSKNGESTHGHRSRHGRFATGASAPARAAYRFEWRPRSFRRTAGAHDADGVDDDRAARDVETKARAILRQEVRGQGLGRGIRQQRSS